MTQRQRREWMRRRRQRRAPLIVWNKDHREYLAAARAAYILKYGHQFEPIWRALDWGESPLFRP